MNLEAVNGLPLAELYALRLAVNTRITTIEEQAKTALDAGKAVPHFKLKQGKTSRYISDMPLYEETLKLAFEDRYEAMCMTRKVIALTAAEKIVKAEFDKPDATDILDKLQDSLDKKTSASTLVYAPQEAL
jgi:hypothetical protein